MKNKIVLSEDLAVDENEEVKVEDNEVTDKLLDNAIANIINKLIIDEFEAIDGYNSAISTVITEMPDSPIIDVLNDIIAEENVHVGQLQRALLLVSTHAQDIAKGTEEGKAPGKKSCKNSHGSSGDKTYAPSSCCTETASAAYVHRDSSHPS